jgi:60 kDa SS-A/Ro ribonucleoprotein
VPIKVKEALQAMLEIVVDNVPVIKCRVVVPMAASILRKNPATRVMPFDTAFHRLGLSPYDSLASNVEKLTRLGGGGTNLNLPLAKLNSEKAFTDLVICVSGNELWVGTWLADTPTVTMREWVRMKARNPTARLVCVDLQLYASMQAVKREDILSVGGFGNSMMEMLMRFAAGKLSAAHRIDEIENIDLKKGV